MLDDIIVLITEHGMVALYPILIFSILRPLGLLAGFIAISWAMRGAQVLRISIAFCLALPMLPAHHNAFETLVLVGPLTEKLWITLKEFVIGYALGLLASLPFLALQYAGAITDAFRGENNSTTTDPTGGTLTTFSVAYLVVGFFAFFSFGGFEKLIENLYATYVIWPIGAMIPMLNETAATHAVELLTRSLVMAFRIALPLLALLVMIELSVAVAARLGRRFNFYNLAFPLRNLAAVVTLPLIMWLIWQGSDQIVGQSRDALPELGLFVR